MLSGEEGIKLPATVLGLMSGTSLDGIDVACLTSDGESLIEAGPWATYPYDARVRETVRGVLGGEGAVAEAERALTLAHVAAVERFRESHALAADAIDLIGFHGHTILHRPHEGRTWQIGDGAALARATGIDVVNDFRSADVAEGGEGAPLAPLYHAALARELPHPLAVLNLGGVANVSWIGEDGAVLAFDTGPANAPIDDWVRRHTGQGMDADGKIARTGTVDRATLAVLLAHPYFTRPPPKSLDRDDFAWRMVERLGLADGAATLTAFAAAAVAAGSGYFPRPPRRWLATGGGRHNPALMAALAASLGMPVEPVEAVGWQGDALEAQAFAWLAVRSRRGLPLSLPSTTGVRRPVSGGRFHPAGARMQPN
ncbi:MAG TPA: anhydro-N-acetylmuramic acid kinase [Alphaproteobacteria bacterium]|nr:anhydro-N-acetylmuramic acid kinase [Alphaproteobacteria bacterium]